VPGYGCEDHFLEQDTIEHSWEVLAVRLLAPSPCTSQPAPAPVNFARVAKLGGALCSRAQELLRGRHTHGIVCDVGLPVMHRGAPARTFARNGLAVLAPGKGALGLLPLDLGLEVCPLVPLPGVGWPS
jgi:hypothetical protein